MLEKLRKLLASETSADIKAAIDTIDLISLRSELTEAEATRADLLLTADDRKIIAAEGVVTTKRLALERGQAARAALEAKLAAAQAREADEAFEALCDRATEATELARREIVEKALPAVETIKSVLEAVGKSNVARAEVQRKCISHMFEDSAAGRGRVIASALNAVDDRFPDWARWAFSRYED